MISNLCIWVIKEKTVTCYAVEAQNEGHYSLTFCTESITLLIFLMGILTFLKIQTHKIESCRAFR